MAKVYIKFPKAGLGNMLFVWAKGFVFATKNDLSYSTSSWWSFHWGAILRQENKKRFYLGYFQESSYWSSILIKFQFIFYKKVREPENTKIEILNNKTIFLFNKVNTDEDLFHSLREHSEIISKELYNILLPEMKEKLSKFAPPIIGVHIRRGDFKLSNQEMSINYYIDVINLIRISFAQNVLVTVFTDADHNELGQLLNLPNIFIAEKKPDILDILLLSKSKILILSQSSTFSYWAAFLSEALVIRPRDDWQPLIKVSINDVGYKEIKWRQNDINLSKKLIEDSKNKLLDKNY